MRIGSIPYMLMVWFAWSLPAQVPDTLKVYEIEEVVISQSFRRTQTLRSALTVDVAEKEFLERHFTGNLMQTLEHIPGIRSMDIGSGFSKPMIRGMAFNRVTVTENGIKQEGQQWGADHGLEIDAFNAERIIVRKGPASLLYGSDAMGGAIEILPVRPPATNQVFGEVTLLGKSVNENIGASVLLGFKQNAWYTRVRYSQQDYGDYRVPTNVVVYLTQRLPIHNQRLKNTAGRERNANLYTAYRKGSYSADYGVSNVYQQSGFFPGAHGVPSASRLVDDGNSRNIELPYNTVNHLKVNTRQQYSWEDWIATWDVGFQNNRREEWSEFHTHYGNQPAPEKHPDKELGFYLNTFSSTMKLRWVPSYQWEHTAGWEMQYQHNHIDGYSFLLPEYTRFTTGWMWLSTFRVSDQFTFSGGARLDYGKVDISPYKDAYLEEYLRKNNYAEDVLETYQWRSYAVNRSFANYSASLGVVWTPAPAHTVKANVGRSFRLPGANELASNGVHHGTFRHEQGDPELKSEQGWQTDLSYAYEQEGIIFSVSPFASWYENYIYLKPTGEWSVLPHAGQVYSYTGAKAVFMGAEASLAIDFLRRFNYEISGEYVYTYNRDENIPLSFSPPASMRNSLGWNHTYINLRIELQSIAAQNRVARNEDTTPGAHLLHATIGGNIRIGGTVAEIQLTGANLLNKKYYNHLSFYRKIQIPEPGRNFQLLVKVPFKSK